MCGIVGLLVRDPELENKMGSFLARMLTSLGERGPDSAGLAIYSHETPCDFGASGGSPLGRTIISLASEKEVGWQHISSSVRALGIGEFDIQSFSTAAWLSVPSQMVATVVSYFQSEDRGVAIAGVGEELRIVKAIGHPSEISQRFKVESWCGDMAVGHTRMATESAVTVRHCHPFVPAPDLCVVHNGSFSNHATVRRHLRSEGVEFDSDNDSEVAARLIARQLAAGDGLEEATRWVMKEMDGFFTMIITSPEGMSVVRDPFACKPAVVAESPDYVAVASEYRALAGLPGIDQASVFEPEPEEVYTWKR